MASPTFAATITDLGLYSTGTQVTSGTDTAWTVGGNGALVVSPLVGGWYSTDNNTSNSQWISDLANGHLVAETSDTTYNYTTSFTVPAQYIPSTIAISGWAAFDDFAALSVGGTQLYNWNSGTFYNIQTNFTIPAGNIVAGLNTITFAVTNKGFSATEAPVNPTGLRVQFTSITGDTIPEPSTLALLGGGLLALGFLRRRR